MERGSGSLQVHTLVGFTNTTTYMRYSIFGFNQKRVVNLIAVTKGDDSKETTTRLDTTDLLILSHIADYPNRSKVLKQIIDGQVFFWVEYNNLLEELPILNIRKQALADRFKKYILLHLVKQELIAIDKKHQNATFFCMTKVYESLLYEREGGYGSQPQEGMVVNYDTPSSSQLQDINNIINNNNNTNNKKEREDKSSPKKDNGRFVKPTIQEIQAHILEKGYTFDAEAFYAHYESNGWKVGKNPMKDWKAACTTWHKNRDNNKNNYARTRTQSEKLRDTVIHANEYSKMLHDRVEQQATMGDGDSEEIRRLQDIF